MDIEFFKLNWHLFVALSVVVALLVLDPLRKRSSGVSSVSPMDLPRVMRLEKAIVVDISDPKDYEFGHVPKARNIPLSRIDSDVNRLNKFRSRPVVIACRAGNRSSKAANILRKHGFNDVRILHGGFAAWTKENLPIEKS